MEWLQAIWLYIFASNNAEKYIGLETEPRPAESKGSNHRALFVSYEK